jgi:CelD/BcsL family acetyltransferase involved in cellulose biosynthesis
VTTLAPDKEPACPGPTDARQPTESDRDRKPVADRPLVARRVAFGDVPRETWDRLAAANPWSTPFSSWAFHRAWWDSYGAGAHDQTLIVCRQAAAADEPIAIVPLMHRHEVEPTDADLATKIRHGDDRDLTPVSPTAKAVFFGASYHADYATVLGAPADLPAIAIAVADHLADASHDRDADPDHPKPWDVVDLRRLRCGDPTADALAAGFGRREMDEGWTLNLEREDVCPVVRIPDDVDFEGYLGTLDKKARHEIRRKLRRAEAAGDVELVPSDGTTADLELFIDLHQAKWGADGLFPPTPGGELSRVFIRRWFEESGLDGPVRLRFVSVGGRRVAAGITVRDGDREMFYNAGADPNARELSPGILFIAEAIREAIDEGVRSFDFLRGDESYKYDWGSVDEPIQRLLVRRSLKELGS